MAPRCRTSTILRSSRLPLLLGLAASAVRRCSAEFVLLDPAAHRDSFVEGWPGPYLNGSGVGVVNDSTFEWATQNLPLFEASDADMQASYYFRAKVYKSHLLRTDWADIKHVVSEQCTGVGPTCWGGIYGNINAAAGHHIAEGRWLRDPSFMDELIRFWIGTTDSTRSDQNATHGHLANGTNSGGHVVTGYSSWILTAALRRTEVKGSLGLGAALDGTPITFAELLPAMVAWWEQATLTRRADCVVANGGADGGHPGHSKACLDAPPQPADPSLPEHPAPYCYLISDGMDAMEGSISGGGCRPTIGSMMWSEALAIAALAERTGEHIIAATFQQRADWIREWYLEHLWNDEVGWLTVYKEGVQFSRGAGGCTQATQHNETDGTCCCLKAMPEPPGRYANFSVCPDAPPLPNAPQNKTACMAAKKFEQSSSWQCGRAVSVRELLGLGPAYYFGITPHSSDGSATKYDRMWGALFDEEEGFWGKFGPTTAERRSVCFNQSQDGAECNWAGPSWPYETSRVLTGLANFLSDYPPEQSASAGMNTSHFTTLLRTYAFSHTHGNATNGSHPWVGENIEPDQGYWSARDTKTQTALFLSKFIDFLMEKPAGCDWYHLPRQARDRHVRKIGTL